MFYPSNVRHAVPMTAVRSGENRKKFTIIDRETVNDKRLTWKARGLLLWLLDKPDDWITSVDRLSRESPDGSFAVRSALKELQELGYLVRSKKRDPKTGQIHWEWLYYENPRSAQTRFPASGFPDGGFPDEGETAVHIETNSTDTEKPNTDTQAEPPTEALRLANLLADLIEQNGSKRPKVTKAWWVTIDRMIRLDDRTPEQIEKAIRWAQANDFWQSNILSPQKLRDKYDTLRLQAKRDRGPSGSGMSTIEKMYQDALREENHNAAV